jgi:two-component system response regulator YesN
VKKQLLAKKTTKIYRQFLFSYSVFLVIILCIGLSSIWLSSIIIEEQVGQIYTASLKQICTVVDSYVTYAAKTGAAFMYNSRVQSLQMAGTCKRPNDIIVMTQLQEDIRNAMIENTSISRIAIYFPTGHFALDNMACIREEMLDVWSKTYYHMSFTDLSDYAFGHHPVGAVKLNIDTETGISDLLYIRTLGYYPSSSRQPVLLISIKGSELSDILREFTQTIGAQTYIVMDDGPIIDESFTLVAKESDCAENTTVKDIWGKITGSENYITTVQSSTMNANYLGAIPRELYLNQVNNVVHIMFVLLAAFIVIGIIFTIFFARRSSAPIEKLTKLLKPAETELFEPRNMYEYIEHSLSDILKENKMLEESLNLHKQKLKDEFLTKLVKGNIPSESLQVMLEYYNIEIEGDIVISAAYVVEDVGPHFNDALDQSNNLINFSVRNAVEELTMKKYDCFICTIEDAIICVSSSNGPSQKLFSQTISIAKTVVEFFEKKLGVRLVVSVSSPIQAITSIPQVCRESLDILECRNATGRRDSVCFPENNVEPLDAFGYSISTERNFINCIKGGDFQRAKKYLNNLPTECRKITSLPLLKVKTSGLISSILTALTEYGYGSDPNFLVGLDPFEALIDAKNIGDLVNTTQEILDYMIEYQERKTKKIEKTLISDVEHYLKLNFCDPQLSISSLAEKFGMNRSSLSQRFKARTGRSPIEYLHRLRVKNAKKLIQEGETNYTKIAEACGYYDSHALNVAFKKYEGLAPSKYRATLDMSSETAIIST